MTRVLVTGDSHLGAMRRAWDTDRERYEPISFAPLGRGGLVPTAFFEVDETSETVRTIAPDWQNRSFAAKDLHDTDGIDLLVVSMALNTSRILRDVSWHTHVPALMVQSPDESPLSDAVVEALFLQDCEYAIAFVAALKAAGIRVAVLEAPRLFARAHVLKRQRLDVSLRIDEWYRAFVKGALRDKGVPVIGQPVQTLTSSGLTRAEFDHENPKDSHHGGIPYGKLALDSILDSAAQLAKS